MLWNEDFPTMLRYHRGITAYKLVCSRPRDFKTEVYVLWGQPGTGKSKWALEHYPNAYWKPRGEWWDGYEEHESVIIDDFYGWLPFDTLLRVLDRYPLYVQIKGGTVNFVAKTIVITSNSEMGKWYKNENLDFNALKRRVEHFIIFSDEIKEFNTYEQCFP